MWRKTLLKTALNYLSKNIEPLPTMPEINGVEEYLEMQK